MSGATLVYPGFFDPITLGHLNIIERARLRFDQVIVLVAKESNKKAMFTTAKRQEMIQKVTSKYKNVSVDVFDGLLVNHLKKMNNPIILRGIRSVSDFEYESQMSLANKIMFEKAETIFMMTDAKYAHLSSTLIKEIARLGGDLTRMVPDVVLKEMKK